MDTDEPISYAELESLDEFRSFGENMANMLITRANATHYLEMLTSLLKVVVSNSKIYTFLFFLKSFNS